MNIIKKLVLSIKKRNRMKRADEQLASNIIQFPEFFDEKTLEDNGIIVGKFQTGGETNA